MRILQITAFSGWGCTGRISVGIHKVLEGQGCESVIAWGRKNTASSNIKNIRIGNAIDQNLHGLYTRFTDKCGFGSRVVTINFIEEIEQYKPDLIQLHIMHGYYINLQVFFEYIKKKNIPIVWTMHDCWAFTGHCPYFDLVKCEKWKKGCFNCIQKSNHPKSWVMDNSSWNWNKKKELFASLHNLTIVTPSKWMAGMVSNSFLSGKDIEIINNGIDLGVFYRRVNSVHEKYGIKGKKIVLGVSSSWVKSKGIDDFISLSRILPDEYVVMLVGLSKEKLKTMPHNIIGIEHTDDINELAELYSAAEVFVNPTYEDNYPTTNLEALACETPVITYMTGGSVESAGEKFGIIVDQGDVNGLAKAIMSRQILERKKAIAAMDRRILDENDKFLRYYHLYKKILKCE